MAADARPVFEDNRGAFVKGTEELLCLDPLLADEVILWYGDNGLEAVLYYVETSTIDDTREELIRIWGPPDDTVTVRSTGPDGKVVIAKPSYWDFDASTGTTAWLEYSIGGGMMPHPWELGLPSGEYGLLSLQPLGVDKR